jgi:Uma2 family endonuclease
MVRRTPSGSIPFTEFLDLIREDQKADLVDGVIFMASPENFEHNVLVGWLHSLLSGFVRRQGLGEVTVNRVAFRLSAHNALEPDVAFIRRERLSRVKGGYVEGPPDLAVEVVSPDSIERDYEHKRRLYEASGVSEYWIIDPDDGAALFLVRTPAPDAEGAECGFVEASLEGSIHRSTALSGFELDVRWLWQQPLPDAFEILQRMFARLA